MMKDASNLASRLREVLDADDAVALLRGAIGRNSITGNEANFVLLADNEPVEFRDDFAGRKGCHHGLISSGLSRAIIRAGP